jgi:glucan phosphoethanolaminetransferase (alkaline phosphatase superfamily)
MFETQQQRHLIMAGILLVVLAGALWFSAWRQAGMSIPPRIEHILPLGAFGFGLFVLAFCLTRLPPISLERALRVLALVNLLVALGGILSLRHYRAFFALVHPSPVEAYRTAYLTNWRLYFYQPLLFAALGGGLLLWVTGLVAWRGGLPWLSPRRNTGE